MHELLRISVGANHVTDKQIDKLVGANDVISLELGMCINSPRTTIRETLVIQQVVHKLETQKPNKWNEIGNAEDNCRLESVIPRGQ